MKYYIKTFGCQMNHSDSERIAGFLEAQPHPNPLLIKERWFAPAKNISEADLVIFNTCGVRQSAEDRVYGQIHNLRKQQAISGKQQTKIVLTGCLSNRKDVKQRLKNKVDLFCEIKDFPEKIAASIKHQATSKKNKSLTAYRLPLTANNKDCSYLNITPTHTKKHTAFVPVMTGCNNFCAYCVVPYARGREVSRPAEEIISEIKKLVKNGYKEIVLLGQNVNSYKKKCSPEAPSPQPSPKGRGGKSVSSSPFGRGCHVLMTGEGSRNNEINFPKLLKLIEKISGKFWISFVSSHPKDYSDELIETIAKSKKICEYIHLPIQAGDNKILEKMNRKYTAEHYLKLVKKIKSAFKKHKPDTLYSITSDIIVGFPGETKRQFLESIRVMKKVKYDMVYFGQFSPRPGTAAWNMRDNVSKKEKERRENYLNEILKKTTSANNKKYVGKIVEVLIDKKENPRAKLLENLGNARKSKSLALGTPYFGRTRTMKNVKIISNKKNLIGKIVKVKITKANVWNLEAQTIK